MITVVEIANNLKEDFAPYNGQRQEEITAQLDDQDESGWFGTRSHTARRSDLILQNRQHLRR